MDLRAFVPRGMAAGITQTKSRKKLLLVMKMTAFILLAGMLHVSAAGWGQTVTLSEKNVPVQQIFKEISRQTGISILYNEKFLEGLSKVSIDVKNASIENVLAECLKNQPLTYRIQNNKILIQQIPNAPQSEPPPPPPGDIHGRVTDSLGNPLAGASIFVKGTKKGTVSGANGNFVLKNVDADATLVISYLGYGTRQYKLNGNSDVTISLNKSNNPLDEIQIIAYGTTTQRLSTGDVSTVTSKEIEEQPVANPLAALEGRVPGLIVTQNTGVPGGGFSVQIRGQNSISNGNNPFYVIDGVPYNAQLPVNGNGLSLINGTLGGGNPLNFINPYDIESIEVLKDADATAIYGSRAANGAILITTKKGKAGNMKFNINLNSGIQQNARMMKLLNTQQYLQMRNEAFKNDGLVPDSNVDFDLTFWDTTRYTNWQKVLTGNTAHYSDAEISISGGGANSQYLIGAGYNRQTTVFPTLFSGQNVDQKASVLFNYNCTSSDKKFRLVFSGNYVSDKNTVQSFDFTYTGIVTPPNAPALYNADGSLNWAPRTPGQAGTWNNPLSSLYGKYQGITPNLVTNAVLSYMVLPDLELKTSFGYTTLTTNEIQTSPTTSYDPASGATSGYSNFNTLNSRSWIIEPQINYKLHIQKGILTALIGGTFHENYSLGQTLNANIFVSDALLENIEAAGSVTASSNSSEYKYDAIFGRLNYNWQDKYLLNLTMRRDGSSRFGPGKQFGNFGAIGVAWIFTNENFIKDNLPFLSFGKLRGSYGTTGNDQIGDYKFLDLYSPRQFPYEGFQGLYPVNLFNPQLAWEIDKKLEGGIELGILKDRLIIQASFYQNRSSNQLVNSPVSSVTGFGSTPANLPALVQNSGTELLVRSTNIKAKYFTWSSSFNISVARNKLISFPGLATSGYANNYVVGKPLSGIWVFHSLGVNDTTGLYQFADSKGSPTYNPSFPADATTRIDLTPKFYGGFLNTFSYKGVSLDVFFQFVKQTGQNFNLGYTTMPGTKANQPTAVLNRWQQPGDHAPYQQYSQDYSGNAYNSFQYVAQSDLAYGDASYIRLKNLAVSWEMPQAWKQKMRLEHCRIYLLGQNLFTITNYFGLDPETQGIVVPPMRTITAGLQVGF